MEKYLIVSLVYKGNVLSELHDLEMEKIATQCKKAVQIAESKGVKLFFKELTNDRLLSESFAEIKHNFDLTAKEKESLVNFIKPFFIDGEIYNCKIETTNTLKATIFLKTNGDLVMVD